MINERSLDGLFALWRKNNNARQPRKRWAYLRISGMNGLKIRFSTYFVGTKKEGKNSKCFGSGAVKACGL